jgi:hypothetical protein
MDTGNWDELRAWIADRRAKVLADREVLEQHGHNGNSRWYDGYTSALALVLHRMDAGHGGPASVEYGLMSAARRHGA